MKSLLRPPLCLMAFFLVWQLQCQDTTETWVTLEGKEIAQEQASLLHKMWQDEADKWEVREYWKSGGLRMSGTYSDPVEHVRDGFFSFYNKNGTKIYEGHYKDNDVVGFWNFWFDSGDFREYGKYYLPANEAERDSIKSAQPSDDNQAPTIHWESFKDSTWVYFHKNGERSGVEHYLSGKLVEAQYWNEDGSEVAPDALVSRMPSYPGGIDQLIKYLKNNILYPKKVKKNGIQGTVYIRFVVNELGDLEDVSVLRSVHPDLDKEAMRVVQGMRQWLPALAQNRPVKVQYNLPIRFALR